MKAELLAATLSMGCALPSKLTQGTRQMGAKRLERNGWLQDVVAHAGTTSEKLLPYQVDAEAFFALAKLKGPDIVRAAAMHNKREFQSQFTGPERFDRSLCERCAIEEYRAYIRQSSARRSRLRQSGRRQAFSGNNPECDRIHEITPEMTNAEPRFDQGLS